MPHNKSTLKKIRETQSGVWDWLMMNDSHRQVIICTDVFFLKMSWGLSKIICFLTCIFLWLSVGNKPQCQPTSNVDHNSGAVTRTSFNLQLFFCLSRSKCNLSDVADFLLQIRIRNCVYKNVQIQNNIIRCNCYFVFTPLCSNMELDG